jgi:hypothetical protein
MEYDLPSILGFLFDNPKWWPAPRCSFQETELAQDIHDGALSGHGVSAGLASRSPAGRFVHRELARAGCITFFTTYSPI